MDLQTRNSETIKALQNEGLRAETDGVDVIWYCSVCGFGYAYFREQPPVKKMCNKCRDKAKENKK